MHITDIEPLLPPKFRGKLTKAEKLLVENAPIGKPAECGQIVSTANSDLRIDADLIRWLCRGEELAKAIDPRGLEIRGAEIAGPLELSFAAIPFPLSFYDCRLDSDADLSYIKIPALHLDGTATRLIDLQGAEVKADIRLNQNFSSEGKVSLVGAEIGGSLDCRGGTFALKEPDPCALDASWAKIRGSVFLGAGFSSVGDVRLGGAEIGGDLDCRDGTFSNAGRVSLSAPGSAIRQSVFLNGKFSAVGEVQLERARIGGNLECNHGTFKNPPSITQFRSGTALRVDGAQITGEIQLYGEFSAQGRVSLLGAKAGALVDDEQSWPTQDDLLLDGFVYERIAKGPTDADKRIEWLALEEKLTPQPYLQLAKVLREMGDEDGAKQVLFALEKRSRKDDKGLKFVEDAFSQATVGYGVYPGRAVWWACGLAVVGWVVHRRAGRMGAMAPTDKDAYDAFSTGHVPEHYQPFNPLIYSIENCIPLVKLGQDDLWAADPSPQRRAVRVATGKLRRKVDAALDWVVPDEVVRPVALRWIRWIMIALGWLLATFFGAALSGFLKSG
jgi:hypothetical protein